MNQGSVNLLPVYYHHNSLIKEKNYVKFSTPTWWKRFGLLPAAR